MTSNIKVKVPFLIIRQNCVSTIYRTIETISKYKIIIYWVYHFPHARIAIIFVTLYEFISPLDPHRELQGGQARQLHRHQGEELEQGEGAASRYAVTIIFYGCQPSS